MCYSPPFSNVTPDLEEVKVPAGTKQGELHLFIPGFSPAQYFTFLQIMQPDFWDGNAGAKYADDFSMF